MQNRTIQSRTKQGLTVVQLWKSKYSSLQLREFDFNDSGKKELCNPIFFYKLTFAYFKLFRLLLKRAKTSIGMATKLTKGTLHN